MSENEDVVNFLENWQSLLQEATTIGCTFDED